MITRRTAHLHKLVILTLGLGATTGLAAGCEGLFDSGPLCNMSELNFPTCEEADYCDNLVQNCVWARDTDWHDVSGALVRIGNAGNNFGASWGDFVSGNHTNFCGPVVNGHIDDPDLWAPNDSACQWICEMEADHVGAVDADCAQDTEARWVMFGGVPLASRYNLNFDECVWANQCFPEDGIWPTVPDTLDPGFPNYGEEIYCIPDPTHIRNVDGDWDGFAPDEFPDVPAVRAWLTQQIPFTYDPWWLEVPSCGLPAIHTWDTADETCRKLCRDLVQDNYLTPFGYVFDTTQDLLHNCDSFVVNNLCLASGGPAPLGGITPFVWDTPNGDQFEALISDVERCELFGPTACAALRSGGPAGLADMGGTLAADVELIVSGESVGLVSGQLAVRYAEAPGCNANLEPCTMFIETLNLTVAQPVTLTLPDDQVLSLSDMHVSAAPGFGAMYQGQIRSARGALSLTMRGTRQDADGNADDVKLQRGSGHLEGALSLGGNISLSSFVNLSPGVQLRIEAAGTVSPIGSGN